MEGRLMIFWILCLFWGVASSQTTASCISGYVAHAGKCYHFSHDTETWVDAMALCKSDGGYLAEINDAAENAFLQAKTKILGGLFWIGGTDRLEENVWIWASSKTPIATGLRHFTPGQPDNNGGDENCLELNYSGGYWNDRPCHYFQKYICEMNSGSSVEIVG